MASSNRGLLRKGRIAGTCCLVLLVALMALLACGAPPLRTDEDAVEKRLREAVFYLASDELQGRASGSRGSDLAAEYIAQQFSAGGLRTDLYRGSAYQEFAIRERLVLGPSNAASLTGPNGERTALTVGQDYRPLVGSVDGSFDLPLAFAGYGISAPELGYDDYAGLDAAGKVVIVLRHEPQQGDPQSVFDGTRLSPYSLLARKISNAASHGVRGILFCTDQHSISAREKLKESNGERQIPETDPLLNFHLRTPLPEEQILVMHGRRALLEKLLQDACGKKLADLEQQIDQDLRPRSCEIPGWRIEGKVVLAKARTSWKNVVAAIPGRGPQAEEAIVVGAHYDHLGTGGITSLAPWSVIVHRGADDNASGVAVLLEIARQLAAGSPPARQVVFVAFTGEEEGLIGSERYVERPAVPLSKTTAMVNLDMVGRLRRNSVSIYGTDSSRDWLPLLVPIARNNPLSVRHSSGMFAPSDHLSFSMQGIPALLFSTGLHGDYHTPSDTADRLNYPGMRQVTTLAREVIVQLAKASWPQGKRIAPGQEAVVGPTSPDELARTQAYLGMRPDPSWQKQGYKVAWVRPGAPADKAGIRAGDVIRQLGAEPVRQISDMAAVLGRRKPGQPILVKLDRDGTEFELKAVLGSR